VGVTGLALTALVRTRELGASKSLDEPIERAGRFLLAIQQENGCFGPQSGQHFMYGHAFATLGVAAWEAASTARPHADSLRRALEFIERARNPYKGWRYSAQPDGDNDASMTSAMMIAFDGAMDAGMTVEVTAVEDGLRYLDELTDPRSGRTGYHERGTGPARNTATMDRFPADRSEALTAAMLHARSLLDLKFRRADSTRSVALLAALLPKWDDAGSTDFYYWFHGTQALRAIGGATWTAWRGAVADALLPHQSREGHAAGSFDPHDPWGEDGGRVYATAINLWTLTSAAHE
jgi:hypothetical protein